MLVTEGQRLAPEVCRELRCLRARWSSYGLMREGGGGGRWCVFVWLRGFCSVVSGLSGATLAELPGGMRPEALFMIVLGWRGGARHAVEHPGARVLLAAPELALM